MLVSFTVNNKTYPVYVLMGIESLYQPFCFDISILMNKPSENISSWLSCSAELSLYSRKITGVITEEMFESDKRHYLIKLKFEANFSLLKYQAPAVLYLHQTVGDVLTKLAPGCWFNKKQVLPVRPLIFQVPHESTADFLQRICANDGLVFNFDNHQPLFNPSHITGFKLISTESGIDRECFIFHGESHDSRFQVGSIIENLYLITDILHEVKQPTGQHGEGETQIYHNKITCLPKNNDFVWKPVTLPVMPSSMMGTVDNNQYYLLDQLLPDIARLNFHDNAHFPLYEKASIVIGFLDNDPNQPIITGSLHDNNLVNYVLANSQTNKFSIDSDADNNIIVNNNTENYFSINKNIEFNSAKHTIIMSANQNIVYDINQDFTEKTQGDYKGRINYNFVNTTQSGNIIIKADNKSQLLQAQKDQIIKSTETIEFNSTDKIDFSAARQVTLSGALSITVGNMCIEMTALGVVNLVAPQITLLGQVSFSVKP